MELTLDVYPQTLSCHVSRPQPATACLYAVYPTVTDEHVRQVCESRQFAGDCAFLQLGSGLKNRIFMASPGAEC